jgi:xanthine dehydrogenase accessory factor
LLNEGEDCIVATLIDKDGRILSKELLKSNTASYPDLGEEIRKVQRRNETRRIMIERGELILEPVPGRPSLVVFGGGHVSKYISSAASMAGFRVTIIDDRREYANAERFPEAVHTMAIEFYDAFRKIVIKPSTYIIIVTRGHRSDEEILERAIKTPAKYIGMIGSKRKVLTTYEHLLERGVCPDDLQRVHAPMGIEIGAATAEEIGISVVAEMIRIRRGSNVPLDHKSQALNFSRLAK